MVVIMQADDRSVASRLKMACLLAGVEYTEFHEPDETRYVFEVYGTETHCEYMAARSGATIVDYMESVPR